MPSPEYYATILVLGPMSPADGGGPEESPRTKILAALLRSIISRQSVSVSPVQISFPDENTFSDIIPGILTMIESSDLVVLDLTGNSAGTMYELGLIHALGLPYILVTSDAVRPFYVRASQCITRLDLTRDYDALRQGQSALATRVGQFLNALLGPPGGTRLEDFATNAVSAYFDGLPIVDISAPAGLAAGYWRNAVRRFVGYAGYFDPPVRTIALKSSSRTIEQPLKIAHFVAVKPASGLNAHADDDIATLEATLKNGGYSLASGAIRKANPQDMRDFGVKLLCRMSNNDFDDPINPGIVIDLPTTLYALQHSPRIERIERAGSGRLDDCHVQRLRSWRYEQMIERFETLMRYHIRNAENKGHINQVHFVDVANLLELVSRLDAK